MLYRRFTPEEKKLLANHKGSQAKPAAPKSLDSKLAASMALAGFPRRTFSKQAAPDSSHVPPSSGTAGSRIAAKS